MSFTMPLKLKHCLKQIETSFDSLLLITKTMIDIIKEV
jgi:hypothetical protein